MASDNPLSRGYTLLMNDDVEELSDFASDEERRVHDDSSSGAVAHLDARSAGWKALSVWAASSALFVYTTKRLLVNYHFRKIAVNGCSNLADTRPETIVGPKTIQVATYILSNIALTLSLRYSITLLLIYILVTLFRGQHSGSSRVDGTSLRTTLRQLGVELFAPNIYCTVMLPSSLSAAISLPMFLEGLLHMPSLPVLVMIFPLVYASEAFVLYLYSRARHQGINIPWDMLAITATCAIILYGENRLMVPGLVWGVLGVIFFGVSRACFAIGLEYVPDADIAMQKAYHGFVVMALAFGILMSGSMAFVFERSYRPSELSAEVILLMVLNTSALIGTSFPGTSIIAYWATSFDDRKCSSSCNLELIASISSSFLLLLSAMFSTPMPYISWIQIAAYLVANFFLLGYEQLHTWVMTCYTLFHPFREGFTFVGQSPASQPIVNCVLAVAIVVFSFTLSTTSSAIINSLSQGPPTIYDLSYNPPSRFDIVVSMYMEDPASVRHMVNQIKSTSLLQLLDFQGHKPRFILYTKDPSADIDALKKATGADTVQQLDNVGREGGTYLAHIVNRWDSLAEQTMFVQAHAHNMRELIPRIDEYLVGSTGMLSLGFTGVTCSCTSCSDRWGWEDRFHVIPAIYERIYNNTCRSSQSILLSYKGQFVASARRIRGINKSVYVELMNAISSGRGWSLEHNTTVAQESHLGGVTGEDSASNPFFGFTMERIWSLLLQCALDERVAARCPSLLSGKGVGGLVQDCQCLDDWNI